MTRFADTRLTAFKRTEQADMARLVHQLMPPLSIPHPTPRLLSPFKSGIESVTNLRPEVDAADLLYPAHNRASRRAHGIRNSDVAQRCGKGHGARWRMLQRAIKPPRIQDIARAAATEETEAA
jgi:hypothetical protein